MLRTAFRIPLRHAEGLMASVFSMMHLSLAVPDHYSSLPSKHFYENDNDEHCSKRWHVSVFQSKDGVNDLYEKFHTINDEECQ
jgi:hypothetical protein